MSDGKNGQRWLSTGYLRARPQGEIDHERGVIEGVSVVTAGEAKGHDVHLDSEFVAEVVKQGNEKRQGVKARFGHPNMCSTALGTFLGRFKNFRQDGEQARADLFLSNEAKKTPNGDLHDYVMGLAENEADMFGTSIVFTPGKAYRMDGEGNKVYQDSRYGADSDDGLSDEVYVECEQLHACDAVDEPAANDGLFSSFANETIAGQLTQFFDLHPQVFDIVQDNPDFIGVLAQYGDKVDEFIERYRVYRAEQRSNKENDMDTVEDTNQDADALEDSVQDQDALNTEDTTVEESTEEAPAESSDETETDEGGDNADAIEANETESADEALEDDNAEVIDLTEFQLSIDQYGAEITASAFADGGGIDEARDLYVESLEAQVKSLQEQVAKIPGGRTVAASDEPKEKKSLFKMTH